MIMAHAPAEGVVRRKVTGVRLVSSRVAASGSWLLDGAIKRQPTRVAARWWLGWLGGAACVVLSVC